MTRLYYERGPVKLFHGDCLEWLPEFPATSFDLLLTDPPYGIGRDGSRMSTSSHGGRKEYEFLGWDMVRPTSDVFREMFRVSRHQIVWGANYFAGLIPPSMGWLVWDKGQDICSSDAELAYTSFEKALRRTVINRVALMKDGTFHPTQKPVRLLEWCLSYAANSAKCDSVIDPYFGSASTAIACIRTGRAFTGCELEEAYCEQAARRVDAELDQGTLFDKTPEPQPVQKSLLG